jgi:hypothetical protein
VIDLLIGVDYVPMAADSETAENIQNVAGSNVQQLIVETLLEQTLYRLSLKI